MLREVTQQQLSDMAEFPAILVYVEIGPKDEYERVHIANAINIPWEQLKTQAKKYLDPGFDIVLYSSREHEQDVLKAAEFLEKQGFQALYFYRGGKEEWILSGLAIESMHYPPGAA